jgi:hypothetical protein
VTVHRPPPEHSGDRLLRDTVSVMLKLGVIAFGGPAVHVAMLREEAVRRRRWLTDQEFLGFCLKLGGICSDVPSVSDNGKPVVRRGRKATGPTLVSRATERRGALDEQAKLRAPRWRHEVLGLFPWERAHA